MLFLIFGGSEQEVGAVRLFIQEDVTCEEGSVEVVGVVVSAEGLVGAEPAIEEGEDGGSVEGDVVAGPLLVFPHQVNT